MTSFEDKLRAASLAILRRELTDDERFNFLELAAAIGSNNVEDFLYVLMVFKRSEDEIAGQLHSFKEEMKTWFDEMNALEKKIDITLETSVEKILRDSAREMSQKMLEQVKSSGGRLLDTIGDYYHVRGHIICISGATFLAYLAYLAGRVDVLAEWWWVGWPIICALVFYGFWYLDR